MPGEGRQERLDVDGGGCGGAGWDFGAPLRRWMRHDLRELLGDVLSAESLTRRGLFESAAVQRLMAANDECVYRMRRAASMRATSTGSGRIRYEGWCGADRDGCMDAAYTIFAVVCIEVWCRMFIGESRNV